MNALNKNFKTCTALNTSPHPHLYICTAHECCGDGIISETSQVISVCYVTGASALQILFLVLLNFKRRTNGWRAYLHIKVDPAAMCLLSEHPSAPTCYPVSYPQLSSPGLPVPQRPFLNNQDLLFTHHFLYFWPLVTCHFPYPLSLSPSPFPSPSPHMA